jgi:hemerythrin
MDQVPWSDGLLVNVPAIDEDHKKLFALINTIFASATHGADAINRAIGTLATYTKEHFAREEASMARAKFPSLADHKFEHEQLVYQLESIMDRLMQAGAAAVDAKLADFLKEWISQHILLWDVAYSSYLRKTGEKG